jgi:hypothetical protein
MDPYKWWGEHQKSFPRISLLARKYLSIPAVCVPLPEVYTYAGRRLAVNRAQLKNTEVSDMTCCRSYRPARDISCG